MTQPHRTQTGGRINRQKPLTFTFDNHPYTGLEGDTLASALIANGVHLMGRSFKYHRPRGLLATGPEEPNALMTISRPNGPKTPNLKASTTTLFEGLQAQSQNRYPSLRRDIGSIAGTASALLPAGFYYKTFIGPQGAWQNLYEPLIRRAAGLGRAPTTPDPDHYAHRYAHTDILIIGAGPAGLSAALAAARHGAQVILCDEQQEPGGSLLSTPKTTPNWLTTTLTELASLDVTILTRTTAFAHWPHNMLGLAQRLTDHLPHPPANTPRERLWFVRAREAIFATGALERPLVFPGNDRPGILLAGAARTLATRYAAKIGHRAVIVTAHDDAYEAARDLQAAGIHIPLIADLRPTTPEPPPGIPVLPNARITGTHGRLRVSAIHLATPTRRLRIPCDAVLMSAGFTPNNQLHAQARGALVFHPESQTFLPGPSPEHVRSAGACRGLETLAQAIEDGAQAGQSAAKGHTHTPTPPTNTKGGLVGLPPRTKPHKAFVDFQNDVTAKDLHLAVREGFRSIEHVKRYTTTGMATDQGKTSNLNALAIVAQARNLPIPQIGLTTFRMPVTPTSFGAFAGPARGPLFDPIRTTPLHPQAAAHGAIFEDVGQWKRARYYPQGSETLHQSVHRECTAVRTTVGLFDASTLGKIEVCGPDAAEFLDRIYVNTIKTLKPGRCRYALMLRETGFLMDDGIVARLEPDRFHLTTTTTGAPGVLAQMEDYLQTEWPHLQAWLTSTTEHWATIAVQGPQARAIITPLIEKADLATLPHMAVTPARIAGIEGRLFRVSFTGEQGYELNVPASQAPALWQTLIETGITPYGTEAMHVLRAEKGYIIVGQDSDGTATPDDLGLAWTIPRAKLDFIGKRSQPSPGPHRKQLVGLRSPTLLTEGAQLVTQSAPRIPIGHVTSSYQSPTLGHPIALAMLENGRARTGEHLLSPHETTAIPVEVVPPVFLDPEGLRLHA